MEFRPLLGILPRGGWGYFWRCHMKEIETTERIDIHGSEKKWAEWRKFLEDDQKERQEYIALQAFNGSEPLK